MKSSPFGRGTRFALLPLDLRHSALLDDIKDLT